VDTAGNIYIADTQNCRIRKVTASTGVISTIAGNGTCGYAGDGKAATSAELFEPSGVAVDSASNVYIADWDNSRIRKITASTGIISTVAGNGARGYSGDGGKATSAKLSSPFGVAIDSSGNIYIADVGNYRIRKVTVSTGFISTVAGNGTQGYSGDGGPATSAKMQGPTGVAVDTAGNIYIADSYGNRIRKVTASTGIISTVAGNGNIGHSGDGGPATSAQLYYPYGVAVDTASNIYIADNDNYRIRKITASTGIISTMAGNGTCGYSGNGGTATSAELCLGLGGVAVDTTGNVYIADQYNERTRAVGPIKVAPAITWATPAPISYGTALSATQLDASTMVPGTFAYSPPSGTLLAAGSQTLSVTFTPTDLIDYSPATATVLLTIAPAVPTITWAPPAAITYGTALSATQLDATANVAGTFAYTPGSGTVLAAGTQTLSVTFAPTNTIDYTTATGTVQLMVSQATTAVTVTSSADPSAFGSPVRFTATITPATATGTATFTDGSTSLGTVAISGGLATYSTSALSVGSHSIVAAYSGDSNDSGSTSSVLTQTVQSLTFVATTGQMAASRYGQTATQLTTGQILITGGMSSSGVLGSADLYSLPSRTFAPANTMNVARWLHSATLLNDGTVLIAGGSDLANEETLDTAEIYNPAAGTFTLLTATLNTARVGHTATLLNNGQVLIVGGYDPEIGLIADAELYDPPTQTFIDLGDTNAPRYNHTATMLPNGQVLIAGGETDPTPSGALNMAEIFDLPSQTFTPVPVPMTTLREGHAAVLLNNGQVLLTGGDNPPLGSLNSAEIYDPPSNTFTAVISAMTVPRISHVMTVLNGGKVLLAGGATDSGGSSTALNAAELYDPTSQTFTAVGNMTSVREHQTASLLNDGTVLEAGGTDGNNIFSTAELYTTSQLNGLASIAITPATSSIGVGSQQLFTALGTFNDGSTQSLASALWSSSSVTTARISGDATNAGVAATAAQGTTTITASAAGVSGSATLTVTVPTLMSIALSPSDATIPLGATQQFTATGVYTDGSTQDLTGSATWSSAPTVVATINSSGLAAGLFQGTATIQVSSGSLNASTVLNVAAPALVSIAVNPAAATVALGTSQQYQATGTYSDGSTKDVTTLIAWSSSASTVATVSASGLVSTVSQGTTTLSVTFESIAATVPLTVGPPNLVSIAIAPDAASVATGAPQQLTATGTYSDGSTQNLTTSVAWASSNSSIAGVSSAGLATAVAPGNTTITATSGSTRGTATLIVTSGTTQASLNTSRYLHGSILLNNGQILVVGGINCSSASSCSYLNSAELYSPGTGAFANTGAMATARSAPAVLLSTGKVLVAGGYTCDGSGNCSSLISAEIYDPVASTFSSAGTMTTARTGHTMTVLGNGTVLIAGGENCTTATSCSALQTAEIYDPVAGTFTAAPGNIMSAARFGASAVLLNSGSVLIAGGFDGTNLPAAAEIYNPSLPGFGGQRPSLNVPRYDASATLLNNGQVLVAGGSTCNLPGCPTNAAEIYDPVANTFTLVSAGMNVSRFDHTATLTTNGDVVVAGGFSSCASSCTGEASTEFFDPVAGTFTIGQPVPTALAGHTGTLLANGNVLLVGGINAGVTLASDEWYQPTSFTPANLVSITVAPASLFLAPGQTQQLVATGTFNDGRTQTLQSVIWNSSNPSTGVISNAPGSAGMVRAQATGATTLTATAGDAGGSASLNVAVLVSLALTPTNSSITAGMGQQLTATGTFSDGSQQNLTTSAMWSCSNASAVLIGSTSGFQGFAIGIASGTATITAVVGSIQATTSVTVQSSATASAPNIISVSPPSGAAGTQVTISGTGFSATQGSGTVWLGSTFGTVESWSDTQIVAFVSAISQSGTAQVRQSGLSSNAVSFSVSTTTISYVSPASGVPGTQVTIFGSGFGSEQGSGQVFLGTTNGVVQSWSDAQIVAEVALGSMTGSARVLQNGVMSNAVVFTVNLPQIISISPNSGAAGTVVTINGSSFGGGTCSGGGGGGGGSGSIRRGGQAKPMDFGSAPTGNYVLIGGAYASVTSWCNTKIVATVPSGAVTGVVKVDADGVWSNTLTFTVPSSGNPVTLVPNLLNLVVGEAQSVQALNASNQPVTGLTWTSSNPSIVSLSTDDPPILTAVAAGNATITAGNAAIDVTVYSGPLPLGTINWSNPGDGSGVLSIVPAVPSASGVADVFATNGDCNVQAIASDGTVGWTANIGPVIPPQYYTANPGSCSEFLPDFQGGLVTMNENVVTQTNGQWYLQYSIQKFDGMTGQPYPSYNSASICWPNMNFGTNLGPYSTVTTYPPMVVHPDGTIFVAYGANPQFEACISATPVVAVINPLTGAPIQTFFGADPSGYQFSAFGNLIVAGDGYAYLPYASMKQGSNMTTTYLNLLRMDTSGNSSSIVLGNWTSTPSIYELPTGVTLITNADQGVLATWALATGTSTSGGSLSWSYSYYIATTSGTSVASQNTLNIPGQSSSIIPIVQAQDGTFVGTVSVNQGQQTSMIAFDSSGNLNWSVPNDTPQIATADGGVIGKSGTTYDSNGKANGGIFLPTLSWTGNAYTDGPVDQVTADPISIAQSFSAVSGANPSGSSTAAVQESMYIRSFAPWQWFGVEPYPIPCSNNCFFGDDRSFSTSLTATARVTGILRFWMPGAILGSSQAFSSPSRDIYGRTKTGNPTMTKKSGANGYALHMEFAGSNPLVPGSPAINTKLDFTPVWNSGQICYSGHLYGDAFPNAEDFVVNSQGQATMLLTFTTQGDPNTGPIIYLPRDNNRDMGSFTQQCVGR